MAAIKRFAFITGFILGLSGFILIVGNVLLYLFTGKLPSVETGENGRPAFGLMAPQDVVTTIKEQMEKERAKHLSAELESGEPL